MTNIVADWPPNIDNIRAVLPVTERNIFAYSHTIYSPSGTKLPPELIAHEEVHFRQQDKVGVREWWNRFLIDTEFRLEQEVEAHRVEWRTYRRHNKDRNHRASFLAQLSRRLASPMYGGLITAAQAQKLIRK